MKIDGAVAPVSINLNGFLSEIKSRLQSISKKIHLITVVESCQAIMRKLSSGRLEYPDSIILLKSTHHATLGKWELNSLQPSEFSSEVYKKVKPGVSAHVTFQEIKDELKARCNESFIETQNKLLEEYECSIAAIIEANFKAKYNSIKESERTNRITFNNFIKEIKDQIDNNGAFDQMITLTCSNHKKVFTETLNIVIKNYNNNFSTVTTNIFNKELFDTEDGMCDKMSNVLKEGKKKLVEIHNTIFMTECASGEFCPLESYSCFPHFEYLYGDDDSLREFVF